MYYFDYAYTGKGTTKVKTSTGTTKVKKAPSCKNRFHYITRTAHYKNHKDNLHEKVEYVKSGNMPSFAEKRPDLFWEAAHNYERKNARQLLQLTPGILAMCFFARGETPGRVLSYLLPASRRADSTG